MTSRVEFCQEFRRIGSLIWSLISTGPKTRGFGYAAAAAAECASTPDPFIYLERVFIPLFQGTVPLLRNSVGVANIPGPEEFFQTFKMEMFLSFGVFLLLEMGNSLGFGVSPSRPPTCLSHPVVPHKPGIQNSIDLLPPQPETLQDFSVQNNEEEKNSQIFSHLFFQQGNKIRQKIPSTDVLHE